ncbi:hypothetical protein BGZ93_008740 [Podila epicladia]|nr:hypothetical protein BGZ92_006435 [Podila epicladia]KAG0091681.1 hypothetical protein BGZ93_008740 [Podila epicladia]
MEHINKICKEQEYPIEVENSPMLGNHAVAARDIPRGEGLLRAIPYAAEVFDNYKKRMCHVCLLYHARGSFQLRCQDCDQVYFCSAACRDIAMGSPSTSTEFTETNPDTQDNNASTLGITGGYHAKVCRTLRKLATWNSDRHTKSIIKLLLHILLNHWKERQGIPTTYRAHRILEKEREKEKHKAQLDNKEDDGVESLVQTLATGVKLHEGGAERTVISDNVSAKDPQDEIQEPIENDFFDVMRLQSHFEDWDEEDNKDWDRQAQIVLALLELSGLTEIATGPGTQELRTLTAQDIKQMISALESNAFGMFDRSKSKPVCFGRAIYPIASFFNHSCDCNSTAVQADGSEERVTSDDVLGVVGAVEEEKQCKFAKKKGSKSKKSKAGNLSDSAPSTPLSSSSPAPSSPPSSPSPQVDAAEEGDEAMRMSSENGEEGLEPSSEPDPYDSRVGEFRMMTFFAIKDISKGQDITISYIDTEMPLQARRLALLSDYHFNCCCERCVREEQASAPGSSKKGSKEKDNKKKGGGRGGKK